MSAGAMKPVVSAGKATRDFRQPRALIVGFLLPAALFYGLFFLFPMARAIYLSFFQGSNTSSEFTFVGLANYKKLLTSDTTFWEALWHNLQFVVFAGSITIVLALALAWGLTQCGRGRGFFRVVFLFPNVMAVVASTLIWSFVFFNPSVGMLNRFLEFLHLKEFRHAWLGEPGYTMAATMMVQIWITTGFYVVLFYAGMLRIPGDYIEAARIDGASAWQEFYHLTLPLLGDIMKIAIVYVIINSLNVFALVYLLAENQAGTYNVVLLTYLYDKAIMNGHYGYGCALGVVTLLLVLFSAGLTSLLTRRESVEL
jgi:N-acetylglucosamine transport system permease protein